MHPLENEWPVELKEAYDNAHKETHREIDIEALRASARANLPKSHAWRQQGPHAICTSCKPSHSVFIGVDKNLIQNEKGEYELVNRF